MLLKEKKARGEEYIINIDFCFVFLDSTIDEEVLEQMEHSLGLVEGGDVSGAADCGEGEAVGVLGGPSADLFSVGISEPFVEFIDGGEVQVLDHLADPAASGVLRNDQVEGT